MANPPTVPDTHVHTNRYAEKLKAAVYALAVREGDVRERLHGAHFYLRQLHNHEIPEHARHELASILQGLTRKGPVFGPEGEVYSTAVRNTLNSIRNQTGRGYAERIFALYREIN